MSSDTRNQYSMRSSYYNSDMDFFAVAEFVLGGETIEFNFATLNLERS